MSLFSHYQIHKTRNEYEVTLYINDQMTEISTELGVKMSDQKNLQEEAIAYLKEMLPNLKVKAIKIVAGTIMITSFGFTSLLPKAEASTGTNTQQTQSHTHIVVSGDTLSHIAKRYGVTIDSIRVANNLPSDFLRIGQVLVIPNGGTQTSTAPTQQVNQRTYQVVSGDTLSHIANRHGTTVEAIRQANNLTSDFLRIGQVLVIPNGGTQTPTAPTQQVNQRTYQVVSGDTLSHIANRHGTTVEAIRQANNLTSDFLRIGQVLVIPNGGTQTSTAPTQQVNQRTYQVVSGDTLSHIANRHGTTVEAIRQANNLTSDFLRIGQVLVIPNGNTQTQPSNATTLNQQELDLLAKIIFSEARGEALDGQIAVGAVIMNRVKSGLFPNNVRDVIYERSHGHFQFSPAGNGELDRATPDATSYEAARRALRGEDPTNGSLYFYNPSKTSDQWLRSRTVSTIIGNHVFAF